MPLLAPDEQPMSSNPRMEATSEKKARANAPDDVEMIVPRGPARLGRERLPTVQQSCE